MSLILAGMKLPVGIYLGSSALLASALDSVFDLLTSAINLFALITAARPADDDHRFGHGKAEALASFFQSLMIIASAFFLVYFAFSRGQEPLVEDSIGYWAMATSLLGTGIIVFFQTRAMRSSQSTVVAADRLHYLSDFLSGVAVLAALFFSYFYKIALIDAIGAVLVAGYLVFASIKILIESINILMDKDISDNYRGTIQDLMRDYPKVAGYHDLKARSAGQQNYLSVHLEVVGEISFEESHAIVEGFIEQIKARHTNLQVTIHADPVEITRAGKRLLDKDEPEFY